MRLFQTIKLALKNIRNNKLRSVLTMIGIIIGISSVITLVSLGSGSTRDITSQIQSLGTNLITVNIMGAGNKQVTLNTVREMSTLSGIEEIAPVISAGVTVKKDRYSERTGITGTTSGFLNIRGMRMAQGRFIADMDNETRQNVTVLGANIARELFGFADPTAGSIRLNGNTYQVIGTLEVQGNSMGNNTDDMIIIPIAKAMVLAGNKNINLMYIKAKSEGTVDLAVNQINSYFSNYFKAKDKTHNVMSQKQLLDIMSSISGILTMLLGGIAAISLVVGGIGVMNVMLVSVTERTKEIGIRKALGGKKKDILVQFLIEALVLSSIGGVLGVIFGIGVGTLMSRFGIPMAFSPDIILLSFSFSLAVGIVFGIVPAYKASKLKPIDALRYE